MREMSVGRVFSILLGRSRSDMAAQPMLADFRFSASSKSDSCIRQKPAISKAVGFENPTYQTDAGSPRSRTGFGERKTAADYGESG